MKIKKNNNNKRKIEIKRKFNIIFIYKLHMAMLLFKHNA